MKPKQWCPTVGQDEMTLSGKIRYGYPGKCILVKNSAVRHSRTDANRVCAFHTEESTIIFPDPSEYANCSVIPDGRADGGICMNSNYTCD